MVASILHQKGYVTMKLMRFFATVHYNRSREIDMLVLHSLTALLLDIPAS